MKITMIRGVVAATAAMVLTVSGCGSDQNDVPNATSPAAPSECTGKNALTAEGSTSQQNAIALFNQAWSRLCPGKNLSYNPTGSGAGRDQFVAGHVDFAGSDAPLSAAQTQAATARCDGNPAWHLPLVVGPVVLAYHLDGVDDLVVSGEVLAGIYSGAITEWNDPAIAALNPGTALPAVPIAPIYRSDSSGTTDNFQRYLTADAPETWTRGAGSEFQGSVGEGGPKSAGVVQAVQSTRGAIGYVEQGFAGQAGVKFARIDSGSGPVGPTDDAVRAAIDVATFVAGDRNDLRVDLDALYGKDIPGGYPLVQVTYEIVCSNGYAPDTAAAVKSFLTAAAGAGQTGLPAAGYVPLPERFSHRLGSAIDAIR